MKKNLLQQFLTRKSLIVGIGFIILASIFSLILNTSQSQLQPPAPTPTTAAPEEEVDASFPVTEPDKQIEGQIIVTFKPEYTDAQITELLQRYDASIIREVEAINMKVLKVPAGEENAIVERMRNEPAVESADGDYTSTIMYIPNDTNFGLQWGFKNTGQTIQKIIGTPNADIKAEAAWDVTRGNGVKIAVLDTGIKTAHPEFAGKIVAQKGFSTATVEDVAGHGTHVAGIVTVATNNGQGIAGTCPDCTLIIGKVMRDDGKGETSVIISGITWAADQGAKVINLSLGSTQVNTKGPYQQAVDYAIQKGAIVVVASGNCGGTNYASNGCTSQNQITYPGASTGVVTVAASDSKDVRAAFSSHGAHVEVAAPGNAIYSTLPGNNPYGYNSGTSMASPMVAGVIGLIRAANPNASSTEIINKLYTTADKISGTGTFWTHGRVNAAKALGAGPIAATTAPAAPTTVAPTFVCAGSADGSVCPPTPSVRPNVTILPSAATGGGPNVTIGQPNTTPGSGTNPTPKPGTQPCTTKNSASISHDKKKMKSQGGFIEEFFKLIFKFIEELLKRFGITIPNPGQNPTPNPDPVTNPNPGPNPAPCPEPTDIKPSEPKEATLPTEPTQSAAPTTTAPTTEAAPTLGTVNPSDIIFRGDFETGNLSQWGSPQACPSGVTIVTDRVRKGKYAAKFTVADDDTKSKCPKVPTDNPRAQLVSKSLFKDGDDMYIGFQYSSLLTLKPHQAGSRLLKFMVHHSAVHQVWVLT